MTDQLREQISAFVDDELPEREADLLIRRLAGSDELRQTFREYHLIGEAIRGDELASHGFAQRMSAALQQERPLPAPRSALVAQALQPIGMVAAAALVAVVAIFSVQNFQSGVDTQSTASSQPAALVAEDDAILAGVNDSPEAVVVPDLKKDPSAFSTVPPVPVSNPVQLRGAELARYVVNHSRYSRSPSRPGILTYGGVGVETQAERDHTRAEQMRNRNAETDSESP